MNGNGKKAMALMLALGFFASFLAIGAPAGATGGRAATFGVAVECLQDDIPTTIFDLNVGLDLMINITITNTGDNATGCNINLAYEDNWAAIVDLKSWVGQTINNDTPVELTYDFSAMLLTGLSGKFWVNVTDGTSTTNTSEDFSVQMAVPSVGEVVATSTNAQNSSMCVLGIDNMTVNVTITNDGNYKLMNSQLFLFLDGTDFLVQMDIPGELAPLAEKTYSMSTNVSGASFGLHTITANATEGMISMEGVSNEFLVVEPKSDVILTGIEIDPMAVTIHKGETVPVTIKGHLLNNGTASAASASVKFYDGLTELCATTTEAIAALATLDVEFVWSITDAIALGNHTIAIGVDTEAAPNYWVEENITVAGVANVSITSLTVSVASEFENTTVTFTAKLFNNGTVDSDLLTVEFYDGTAMIGSKTNVTVAKGQTLDVTFQWTLPLVDLDTNKTIKAKVAGVEGSVALTIKNKVPIIEFTPLALPAGMRQYDKQVFNITVKNNGSANAVGVVIKVMEGGYTTCTTAPFNLSVGESKTIQASVEIQSLGDANVTFNVTATVGGASFTTSATVKVLHYIFGKIGITAFKVAPSKKDNQPKDSTQTFKATLTLKNIGEKSGTVSVTILDGLKILVNTNVSVDALASKDVTYDLKIKGSGTHKLTALVGLPDPDAGNMTKTAKCELQYQPGFETVVLVGAVLVAIVLLRRRKN